VPYLFANPELKTLPIVGTGNLSEPELLAAYHPDVIFCTYFTRGEANELQEKCNVPVVVLDYGDFNDRIASFYATLNFLGDLLDKKSRADSLISYIKNMHKDLSERADQAKQHESQNVYVGGIAYRGAHGINSTEPQYAPFRMLKANNVASGLGEVTSSPKTWLENAFIDIEQLIEWNPDLIFLDAAGKQIWLEDLEKEALQISLKAFKSNQFYTVLPHNWYTTNYENILCNAYFIGKTLYPEQFSDINIKGQSDEIYTAFLGKPVYDSMMLKFGAYQQFIPGQ
jgi:iron complex transport system substrate-binding protein